MNGRTFWKRQSSPTSCREVGRFLQDFLDGEVEPSFSAIIGRHLEDCRDCGLDADTYQAIKNALANHRPEVPDETLARLRQFGANLTNESH